VSRRYSRKLYRRMDSTRREPPVLTVDPLAVVVGLAMAAVLVTLWGVP